MPRFDLGDANAALAASDAAPVSAAASRRVITWSVDREEHSLHLLVRASVEAGRQSTRDLCLRVEPTSDPENYEKSKLVSSHHFSLRYVGNGVQFIDVDSTNGSFNQGKRIGTNVSLLLVEKTLISLAEVLDLEFDPIRRTDVMDDSNGNCQAAAAHAADTAWLQANLVGAEKPGEIAFLRISRKNNLPSQQYVLLFHSGWIGSDDSSLLRVPVSEMTPRRKRAFDIGDAPSTDPARLLARDGAIWIERTGADEVRVGGEAIDAGQARALPENCELIVGKTTFVVAVDSPA
jgi:hypothetical protein